MRVIGYVRVSTKDQAKRFGPKDQEAAIRAWCRQQGHRVVRVAVEPGISGKQGAAGLLAPDLENGVGTRPRLSAALADVEAGAADALVVHDLTRLSRQVMWQELIAYGLRRKGRELLVVRGADDGLDDMTRQLLRTTLGGIAEYEHALLVARLQDGRRTKAAAGGYAGGHWAYGRRVDKAAHELVEHPAEAAAVARAVALRRQGVSLRVIARTLTGEGYRPRGTRWHPTTVARILARAGAAA